MSRWIEKQAAYANSHMPFGIMWEADLSVPINQRFPFPHRHHAIHVLTYFSEALFRSKRCIWQPTALMTYTNARTKQPFQRGASSASVTCRG